MRQGDWVVLMPEAVLGVVRTVCFTPGGKVVEEAIVDGMNKCQYILGKSECRRIIVLKNPDGLRLIKEVLR